jgi:hypothetical protein
MGDRKGGCNAEHEIQAMTPDDVLDLADAGAIGPAICARDLPLPMKEATLLLRAMSRAGLLSTMLPGVHTTLRESTVLRRVVGAAGHVEAIAAYGRLHRRMTLPAPVAAANMVGLSLQVPARHLFVWNGPVRRLTLSGCPLRVDPLPDWASARTTEPSIPFLLAMSAWEANWNARDLDGLARRLGPDGSRMIAHARRAGLPRHLALCLDRFRRARIRIHGPDVPPSDPMAVVVEVAASMAPEIPFDRCRATSSRIVSELSSRGLRCRMLRCSDRLGDDLPDADRRWLDTPPARWVHYVVHVPSLGVVVDATWRQFDPSADPVRIGDLARTRSEWGEVVEATS